MMSEHQEKPTVFISYSHKDEDWKNLLLPHLRMLEKAGRLIVVWDDRKIDGGRTWYPEIVEAMERAAAAVCLISANYLASDFINKEEIPFLLKRRRDEGMLLLPVLTHQCLWEAIEWLEPIQMLPGDGKSVAEDFDGREHVAFKAVAKCVLDFLQDVYKPPEPPAPRWAELAADCVSTERLPRTGAEVFGRKEELGLLDEVWESETTRIVSFVAWGGVGKSALVNKWVERMGEDNYRGAERVYAWSFYSQGTGERVTSSDLFIDSALRWFGDSEMADSNRSPWDKGLRLAEHVQKEKTLLLLDGLEPLQSAWEHDRGRINDPALAVLVKQLARKNPGLCVITTREGVTGLDAYSEWFAEKGLEHISAEAGRALLRVGGIRGTDAELEQVTRDFGNHALAVNLLTAYLSEIPGKEVAHASEIPDLDIPDEKGRHPRRVMEAFAKRYGEGPELNVLYMMGLFDRPARADEISYLRKGRSIRGLTNRIGRLSKKGWRRVIQNLRSARLIAPESHHEPGGLDAHPLVREHFGGRLRAEYGAAWKEAHSRLYDYYKALPKKDLPDRLGEMLPLYQAVSHGCLAGRHQEALDEVYWRRIQRREEAYSSHRLGVMGPELAALAGFFDEPWGRPVRELREGDKAFVLTHAGYHLRALGRLAEAAESMRAGLGSNVERNDWKNAAIQSGNLSQLFLTLGNIAKALDYSERSLKYAEQSGDAFQRMGKRAVLADALHRAGRLAEAEARFGEAEAIQKGYQREYPFLYSLQGFWCCDLLLARGEHREAGRRAAQTLEWALNAGLALVGIGLDHLTLGRGSVLAALEAGTGDFSEAADQLEQAVDGLRRSGEQHYVPRGLLARAELHRVRADFDGARRDLEEAYEIAARGGMRLHECDAQLECCRLILAMVEAGAQLDAEDIFPDSPLARFGAADRPLVAARKHVEKAEGMINEMGYHRRDPEVLLEGAHLEIVEGKKDAARKTLARAKKKIDEMGCHRWDIEVRELGKRL